MFGYMALPAWGLYLRHAKGVALEDIRLSLLPGAADARKMIVRDYAGDNRHTAEDIVEEIFVNIVRKPRIKLDGASGHGDKQGKAREEKGTW